MVSAFLSYLVTMAFSTQQATFTLFVTPSRDVCLRMQQENESSPYDRLFDWATGKGTFLSEKIQPRVRPPCEGGAGIFARKAIPQNEELVRLPYKGLRLDTKAILSVLSNDTNYNNDCDNYNGINNNDGALLESKLAKLDEGGKGSRMIALTGALAHLHLLTPSARRIESTFGPFLDVLPLLPQPQEEFLWESHVLRWSSEEISILLGGTMAHTRAVSIRKSAVKVMNVLADLFVDHHCEKRDNCNLSDRGTNTPSPLWSENDVRNALISSFASVLSRGFQDSGNGECFIPILDLLNHTSDKNVRWNVSDTGMATLRTIRDVAKGEELMADYGSRPSWDYLVEYGFVPNAVENDSVGVPLFPISMTTRMLSGDSKQMGDMVRMVVSCVEKSVSTSANNTVEAPTILGLYLSNKLMHPCVTIQANTPVSSILPVFQATSCVLLALSENRGASMDELERAVQTKIVSTEGHTILALELLTNGIEDRIRMLDKGGKVAEKWQIKRNQQQHEEAAPIFVRQRLEMAETVREAELHILASLQGKVHNFKYIE